MPDQPVASKCVAELASSATAGTLLHGKCTLRDARGSPAAVPPASAVSGELVPASTARAALAAGIEPVAVSGMRSNSLLLLIDSCSFSSCHD